MVRTTRYALVAVLIFPLALFTMSATDASNVAFARTVSNVSPCPSVTATGCDKSKLQVSKYGSSACKGKSTGTITASPIALRDLAYINPMGLMIGGHVTPIDHGYFYVKGAFTNPPQQAAVYSPISGNISTVTRTVRNGDPGANADHSVVVTYDDYAVTIEATCTFRIRFSNLVRFGGKLGRKIGQLGKNQSRFPNYAVKAGELIGYTGHPTANGIDVWVENDNATLTGFVNPVQYTAAESWKTHMVDLFNYTKAPLKNQLLAYDLRSVAPRWGKIDYDIDGKLVGSWFKKRTGGYGGLKKGTEGYWAGHLSIVYDGIDPSQIEISFGSYQGKPGQFVVVGNTPDPATVDQSSGVVKYELDQIQYYSPDSGQPWDGMSYIANMRVRAAGSPQGTVLMQLISKRVLKVEIFPGQSAAQVTKFDSAALIYER